MTMAPASTGIGAPGTQPAPGSLATSAMAAGPTAQAPSAIPFTRGSSIATMQDFSRTYAQGASDEVPLQTNAFLAYLVLDVELVTAGNAAAVAFAADAPFSIFQTLYLNDPANQAIITPISGYQLYLLNKYLPDTSCAFDPQTDPNYTAVTGTVATGGSFSFRLVIPVEHRRRDAFGALNNSAANQRYQLNYNIIATFAALYTTAPTTEAATVSISATQVYWTSPPASLVTTAGQTSVNQTPAGLGSVGFARFESHNEMSGGGAPQIQLNNVGDYISTIIFVLRASAGSHARDAADWPPSFQWWVNDFQVHNLTPNMWQRWMARSYGYRAAIGTAGGLDTGVYVLPYLHDMFDDVGGSENASPANQYLATDATTKLQIRGSEWGAGAGNLEVITRLIRPVSGAALFA